MFYTLGKVRNCFLLVESRLFLHLLLSDKSATEFQLDLSHVDSPLSLTEYVSLYSSVKANYNFHSDLNSVLFLCQSHTTTSIGQGLCFLYSLCYISSAPKMPQCLEKCLPHCRCSKSQWTNEWIIVV